MREVASTRAGIISCNYYGKQDKKIVGTISNRVSRSLTVSQGRIYLPIGEKYISPPKDYTL